MYCVSIAILFEEERKKERKEDNKKRKKWNWSDLTSSFSLLFYLCFYFNFDSDSFNFFPLYFLRSLEIRWTFTPLLKKTLDNTWLIHSFIRLFIRSLTSHNKEPNRNQTKWNEIWNLESGIRGKENRRKTEKKNWQLSAECWKSWHHFFSFIFSNIVFLRPVRRSYLFFGSVDCDDWRLKAQDWRWVGFWIEFGI